MTTEPTPPSDDDLVEIGAQEIDPEAWGAEACAAFDRAVRAQCPTQDTVYEWTPRRESARGIARAFLARIRAPLEARGIELAADRALEYGEEPGIADELRALARQRAEQGDGK